MLIPYRLCIDFYCSEKQFAIELDGSQHIKNKFYDQQRLEQLKTLGIRTIRFWDNDVLQNIDGVLEQIVIVLDKTSINKPHPDPLLKGEVR